MKPETSSEQYNNVTNKFRDENIKN